jgi:hypothetical protein
MFKKHRIGLGMVAHACKPHTQEAEAGGSEFEAGLDYAARLSQSTQTIKLCTKSHGGIIDSSQNEETTQTLIDG